MGYINTTFAHGNGPYARCVEWAIEVNNVREKKGLRRLPIVVPLVYPGRQERIMNEEIGRNVSAGFLQQHPNEIWLDRKQGELLGRLLFKGSDYAKNLRLLATEYPKVESEMHRHLDGKRTVESLCGGVDRFDLRDVEFQLGINNRMQTGLPNQFYTAGAAGPFDELLEKAIADPEVGIDRESMERVLPIARRMIENQKIIFSNVPGVFSYDESRILRDNEVLTPPFVHTPKPDDTELPGRGVYVLMTGIDGIRESGMFDYVAELGMQIYTPEFSMGGLPKEVMGKAIALEPNQIMNPNIVAQYARAGWSSVWISQMAEKGFITPAYQKGDDPEMVFNHRVIKKFGLGAIIKDNPRATLEEAIELAQEVGKVNDELREKYGTLDGINYSAEKVVDWLI